MDYFCPMNYPQTLDWMFAKLPMYQREGKIAFKKDLTNILAFSKALDSPEKRFKTIHVGGTNGKGSTSHMIASILQEAGYKVGLYTSPHLKNFTERIRINGMEIPKQKVVSFISQHQAFLENQKLSFFEMTVGMAFDYFANQNVDIAIVEVGLGGRLDSTNIIVPEVSVITNIGLDHTQFLGETLPEIAFEKAGIIKKQIPVIIGEEQAAVKAVFLEKANAVNATVFFASTSDVSYKTDLLGEYQRNNAITAAAVFQFLKGFTVSAEHIKNGLLQVVKNTSLKGRWQILQEEPLAICDTAHNKEGLALVLNQLKKQNYQKLHIVLGMVAEKSLEDILPLFPKEADYYFCKPAIPRGLSEEVLEKKAMEFQLLGKKYASVENAYANALLNANQEDIVFVGGSTFVVAEII